MGADYNQCIKAFTEAESYHGPSIIIAYAPCINHGIRAGMSQAQTEIKNAVAGWLLAQPSGLTRDWLLKGRIPSSWIPRLPLRIINSSSAVKFVTAA